jgi:hypothetical protein
MTQLAEPRLAARGRIRPVDVVETVARALAGIGVAISADVHFDLWYSGGFRDIATVGPLFLLNAVGGLLIAVLVICWRHWLSALAAVGFGASTLVAFWWSVLWGLFGVNETATGQPQITAEVAEIVAMVGGVVALACWYARRHRAAE